VLLQPEVAVDELTTVYDDSEVEVN
jgi:hypothetical protein